MTATRSSPPAADPAGGAPSRAAALCHLVARVVAGWFGALAILNAVASLRSPGYDQNVWWIDLRTLPAGAEHVVLALTGVALLAWACVPSFVWCRRAATVAAVMIAIAATLDVVRYYRLWSAQEISPTVAVPLSLGVAIVFVVITVMTRRTPIALATFGRLAVVAATSVVLIGAVPLAQMAFFGTTDYRRPADAIVVLGARVMPDGTPSIVLADRVRTAAELYREGLAPTVVMSGGLEPDTGYDESAVMAAYAISLGVPPAALIRDPQGVSTEASVDAVDRLAVANGWDRLLVVSHFYHLPRVHLAFARAGVAVATVPAVESRHIPQTTGNAAREIPALWSYYVRGFMS